MTSLLLFLIVVNGSAHAAEDVDSMRRSLRPAADAPGTWAFVNGRGEVTIHEPIPEPLPWQLHPPARSPGDDKGWYVDNDGYFAYFSFGGGTIRRRGIGIGTLDGHQAYAIQVQEQSSEAPLLRFGRDGEGGDNADQ
ncbi:MAG: hypothetical protein AB1725_01860 [Armatimonadota bacterium]